MDTLTPLMLNQIESLNEVPKEQLQWLIEKSIFKTYQAGEILFSPGNTLLGTHFIIKGALEIYILRNNNKSIISEIVEGGITGILPFSRANKATGYGQCIKDSSILTFPKEYLKEMILDHYELTQALVHVMTSRVRDFTALQQQNEKMMALGKLSAGLAHELNNPASAIARGAASLKQHLQLQPDTFKQVISIKLSSEAIDVINKRLYEVLSIKAIPPHLTMVQKMDLEGEIEDWLFENQIKDFSDVPENFIDFGLGIKDLELLKNTVPNDNLQAIILWINSNLVTERMVSDIEESSKRIAHLVGSVKNFAHMDGGGDKKIIDIHSGIKNTLTMLNHKLKSSNIKVEQQFDTNIPQVKVFVGELNQVWTNLIDNACDALFGIENAKLIISTKQENGFIKVNIEDNGGGIPDDVITKIFDPFFTTKEIGKGTGLGLDVVNRIVRQHNGSVKVNSKPGETNFEVCFPIEN
ncbi:cyclic nucleotide-binding protein [Pedobacter psychrophilus]|uniref:histidine kinase n=1 Tax=Pedobacter psychrophilus TaxID=1826909 RepID=A0A179DBU3_9SPHI|nr:ATP-binding protein [Pedobacter psychrophilus]OAQ38384.1 cyclic nucleotide-binding protein [Pedobacter psychrophilus]